MALLECFREHVNSVFGVTVSRSTALSVDRIATPAPMNTDLSHAQVQSEPKDDVKRIRIVLQSDPIVKVTESRR